MWMTKASLQRRKQKKATNNKRGLIRNKRDPRNKRIVWMNEKLRIGGYMSFQFASEDRLAHSNIMYFVICGRGVLLNPNGKYRPQTYNKTNKVRGRLIHEPVRRAGSFSRDPGTYTPKIKFVITSWRKISARLSRLTGLRFFHVIAFTGKARLAGPAISNHITPLESKIRGTQRQLKISVRKTISDVELSKLLL